MYTSYLRPLFCRAALQSGHSCLCDYVRTKQDIIIYPPSVGNSLHVGRYDPVPNVVYCLGHVVAVYLTWARGLAKVFIAHVLSEPISVFTVYVMQWLLQYTFISA